MRCRLGSNEKFFIPIPLGLRRFSDQANPRQTPLLTPSGAADCSHGWSGGAAQPADP
jgi:hypothetical protein